MQIAIYFSDTGLYIISLKTYILTRIFHRIYPAASLPLVGENFILSVKESRK